jgi:hypothetical protein
MQRPAQTGQTKLQLPFVVRCYWKLSHHPVATTVAILVPGATWQAWWGRRYRSGPQQGQGPKSPGPYGLRPQSVSAVWQGLPVHRVLCCAVRLAGAPFGQQRSSRGMMR